MIRARILGGIDQEDNQWRLQWCYVNVDDTIRIWQLDTRFSTLLECFSYGKNLILKHVTDKGRSDTADQIEWWLKGDKQYYCSHCISHLDLQDRLNQGTLSEVLHLTCQQCHSEMRIPANAFTVTT